jgi:fructose-1,6-bisphosphatase I
MPEGGNIYSVNESNFGAFPESVQRYLLEVKASTSPTYTSRYVGSFVADFHRTLLKGGVFLYPQTASAPKGKLRLMYECNPMAYIAEQAGGLATDGHQRILDIVPETLHQRTPLFIGSRREVEGAMRAIAAGESAPAV